MHRRTFEWFAIGSAMLTMAGCDPSSNVIHAAAQGRAAQAEPVAPSIIGAGLDERASGRTRSPIKHVVVIVGENRTFDHVFATYKAKHGQYVDNLLAKGIIK